MNTNQTIRWGIIGCGDVTEKKSGPALSKLPGSELVAVMRRNAEKAADYAARHQVPRWYADADALIADPEVDAVYIATPPSSHKEYTLKVAAAGKPVFVEKPMALNVEECVAMNAACEQAGVPLLVAYYRRKLPRFEKMRQLIQDGVIGQPRAALLRQFRRQSHADPNVAWKVDPAVNGGGLFVDMQTHALDWLDYVIGPVEKVQGAFSNQGKLYEAEDTVSYSLLFNGGFLASGLFAYTAGHEEESVTVYGTEGYVSMGFFRASPVQLVRGSKVEEFDLPDPPHVHQPLIETVLDHIRGTGTCPSTGTSAIRTTQVVEDILGVTAS